MTVEIFLTLIVFFSTVTSLVTEAVKKLLDEKVAYNLLVLLVALIVGCAGTAIYYLANDIPYTAINVTYLILMGIANWIGAMVGYDKIKQLISQINGSN